MEALAPYIQRLALWAVPVLAAVVLHEVAHGYVAYRLGDSTAARLGRLTLNPFAHIDLFGTVVLPLMLLFGGAPFLFGYAKPVPVNFLNLRNPRRGMVLVALAGPVMNLLLAGVSALVVRGLVSMPIPDNDFLTNNLVVIVKMAQYGVSFNMDGIWGGNMYAGGAGAILPNKITSKHNIRYTPKMNGLEIVKKIRAQLDKNGYKDVELKLIGDVPWSKMSYDTDIARAITGTYDIFGIPYSPPPARETILTGGYWPSYLFSNGEVGQRVAPVMMPIGGGGAGHGGNAHAANEYYVIEGAGKVYGIAGAEKSIATILYNFAGKNAPPAEPRKTN